MNHILKSALVKSSIALACISASTSYAQEVEEIVVTAKGNQTIDESLFTTHVFTELDIQAAQVEDVPELLDRVAGISVNDSGGRGSTTNIFVRGSSTGQILVLVDGIRVGSAASGVAALNSYPVESIERIEVVKGPFSGIYGSDAAGGVIQIFTKKGGDGLKSISSSFGSNGLQEYGASLNLGNDQHGLHISLQHENQSGFDRSDTEIPGDRDGFKENAISINGKTTLHESTTASLSILYTDSDVEFDEGVTENKDLNLVLNVSSQINDNLVWSNIIGINDTEADTDSGSFINSSKRESFNTEFAYSVNSITNVTFGADYYKEDVGGSTSTFVDFTRDNKGYYAQLVTGYDAISLVTSLRRDENSDYGDETNYSVALGYKLNDQIRFSLNNGTSFKAPTFFDLFLPVLDFGPFGIFGGNPDVQPEESESYEFNIIGEHNNINWSLSLYQTDFENLIQTSQGVIQIPTNISRARIEGYEVTLDTKLLDWDLNFNIDVLSTENLITGQRLPDRAEETFNLSASRDFGKYNFAFNLKYEHDRFDQIFGEPAPFRLSSYVVVDARTSIQLSENLVVTAKVDNLFNENFTVNNGFNTGGRLAKVSLKYAF